MSSAPVPGTDGRSRTELVLALPAGWPTEMDDASHWPFALLQNVAGYPHATGVTIAPWETLAFADPPEPLGPGTALVACLVAPPRLLPADAASFIAGEGVAVDLLALVPIYADELALARREGGRALGELLDAAGVTELLEPTREPVTSDGGAPGPGLGTLDLPDKVETSWRRCTACSSRTSVFVSDNLSRGEMDATIALRRSDLDVLWGRGEHLVVRSAGVRELLGDVQPRERVEELAAIGPRPATADARAAELDVLAAGALGRMSGALFRGRIAELAVELAADEEVLHLSDGKLERVNGLVVLTSRRLFFLGEAIRRSKRREAIISLEDVRDHERVSGLRPSVKLTAADGPALELRLARSDVRHLSDVLEAALQP